MCLGGESLEEAHTSASRSLRRLLTDVAADAHNCAIVCKCCSVICHRSPPSMTPILIIPMNTPFYRRGTCSSELVPESHRAANRYSECMIRNDANLCNVLLRKSEFPGALNAQKCFQVHSGRLLQPLVLALRTVLSLTASASPLSPKHSRNTRATCLLRAQPTPC